MGAMGRCRTAVVAASVIVLAMLATACGDDDTDAEDTGFSLPGEGEQRSVLPAGVVIIELQSSSARFSDTIELDVIAAGADANESSVFATCSALALDGGEERFQVGVTDLRRLQSDSPLVSVELVARRTLDRRGEAPATMFVFDHRQRQAELAGTIAVDGPTGTFSVRDERGVQVRGSFRCGRTAADVATTTTATAPTAGLAGIDVDVTVEGGEPAPAGSLTATAASLGEIEAADDEEPAHCSGVTSSPTGPRYVVRLDAKRSARSAGGLRGFELEVHEAMNAAANRATLVARFARSVRATGTVAFDAERTGGTFTGVSTGGSAVTASFSCRAG